MLTKLRSLTHQDVLVTLVVLLVMLLLNMSYVTINSNICQKAPESTSISLLNSTLIVVHSVRSTTASMQHFSTNP